MKSTTDQPNPDAGQSRRDLLSGGVAAGLVFAGNAALAAGTNPSVGGSTNNDLQVDYLSATASCRISFTSDQASVRQANTIHVGFGIAARGCGKTTAFDEDRNRNVYQLQSVMTLFHADDKRPAWLRALQKLSRGATPTELKPPVDTMAMRLLQNYGPGSITIVQDSNRPVYGEVVANEEGRDGKFFPANSYFDQYLVVQVAGRTFVNKDPLRVSSTVNRWPPQGEVYRSERLVPFFDVKNLDGPPVCQFGGCTISIGQPLTDGERVEMEQFIGAIRSIRSQATNR
jgi:hypothetical protein